MILLRLKGGLGEQLFQLGAAIRLAKNDINLIKFDKGLLADNNKNLLNKIFVNTQLIPISLENKEIEALKSSTKTFYSISDTENGPFVDNSQMDWYIDFDKVNIILDGEFQTEININCLKNYIGSIYDCIDISKQKIEDNNLIIYYPQTNYLHQDVIKKLGLVKLDYVDRVISNFQDKFNKIEIQSDILGVLTRFQHKKNIIVQENKDEIEVFKNLLFSNNLVITNSALSIAAAFLSKNLNLLIRPNRLSRKYLIDELIFQNAKNKNIFSNSFYSYF